MSDRPLELTELERVECNRRMDIAGAVLSSSERQFARRSELKEQIDEQQKRVASKWWWIVGITAFVLFYFLNDGAGIVPSMLSGNLGFAGVVALLTYVYWCIANNALTQLKRKDEACLDALYELAGKWAEAVGRLNFWELGDFVTDSGVDEDAEDFQEWWSEQRYAVWQRVCDWDKAEKLRESERERRTYFRDRQKIADDSDSSGSV